MYSFKRVFEVNGSAIVLLIIEVEETRYIVNKPNDVVREAKRKTILNSLLSVFEYL